MHSEITQIAAGILRLRAANASAMTGSGTNSYVVQGPNGAVVIDPGPDLPAHRAALLGAVLGAAGPVAAILITHAHLDHSALAPWLAAQTGAQVLSYGAVQSPDFGGEGADYAHKPDTYLRDGMNLDLAGLEFQVLHTPGHMQGHLCFGLGNLLFTGDHVMGWSSTLIAPPEGDMAQYRAALQRLAGGTWAQFLPGHGEAVLDPALRLAELIAHRAAREAAILAALRDTPASAIRIAQTVYTDISPALRAAAAQNVLAHLIDLAGRNLIAGTGPITLYSEFHQI